MKKIPKPKKMKLKKPVKIKDRRPKKSDVQRFNDQVDKNIFYDPEEYDDFSHYYETNE